MRAWLSGCAALALVGTQAFAQDAGAPPTTITPDTMPRLSTGTTATTEGAVTTIDGGVRAGDNLFHSFARFNLGPGDVARWTASDALTIRNVINRVTGGETSFIAGTIDTSAMPGADFFFLNPAGIVFGDGAAIDVGGTAHFSTAHQLGFADGTMLVSGTASGSRFSMADPVRFGFLGNNAPIAFLPVEQPDPDRFTRGNPMGRLSLSAGDILFNQSTIFTRSFDARAAGQGRGNIALGAPLDQGLRGGRIELQGSRVFVDIDGYAALAADPIALTGRSAVSVIASAADRPAIAVLARRLEMTNSELEVFGVAGDAANAGDIDVRADSIRLGLSGAIRSESMIEGGGGTIRVTAGHLLIDEGDISASGLSAPGRSVGNIHVRADLLEMINVGNIDTALDGSDGRPIGTTGHILIEAGRILMDSSGLILAENLGDDASGPGSITIRADEMRIGFARISTRTETAIAAGPIDITVKGLLELSAFGGIQSISQGPGSAGAITIRSGSLRLIDLDNGAPSISSETELPRAQEFTRLSDYIGGAGRIVIETDSLEMIGRSSITTSSSSLGNAGDILISARTIALSGEAEISSAAGTLLVPPSREDFEADPDLRPSLREMPGPARAGRILIATTGTLTMNGGTISTATEGFGAAGEVTVVADRIVMGRGSRISSEAGNLAPGQAGTVALIARQIALSDGAEVTTSSANATTAGGIALAAEEELLVTGQGSRIASTNTAAAGGAAGNISVGAPRITLGPGGTITTSSMTGAAGQIELLLPETGLLRLAGGAMPATIATSSGPGTGGRIVISRPYALIADGARIEALGQQRGANVQLATDFFIRSADASNLLLVDGDLVVDSQVGNVSSGIDTPDISFGDAAGVLAGQCRAARSSGSVSRLSIDQVGPLALDALDVAPSGACR